MPSGWPSAIAPPFTFSFASSKPIVSRVAIGTEAKASLTSQMSMSSALRSARAGALRRGGLVPASMLVGFVPAPPVETNRARGSSFSSLALSGVVTRIPHAPSLMPLELPAVIRPSGLNAAGRDASFSSDVVRRGCSSVSNIRLLPLSSKTGTGSISFLKRPSSIARIALRWDQSENSSICSRVTLYLSATRSAEMPCWTISYFSRSLGLSAAASDPRGTRDIDSTPPAITTSAWPVMTSIEAKLKACSPEAHIRFTLVPGTDSGNPAIKGARRPMFRPCSSTWVTHPRITSSTNLGSIPARSTRDLNAKAARSSGLQSFKAPPRFPIGVRTAPTITASRMGTSLCRPCTARNKKVFQSTMPRPDKGTRFRGRWPTRADLSRTRGHGVIPANKVKHVVIILKENHTFDNYFGTFPGANGVRLPRSSNPPARDAPHTHAAWLTRQTTAVHEQFVEQDIPAYFSYARKFCLCDN